MSFLHIKNISSKKLLQKNALETFTEAESSPIQQFKRATDSQFMIPYFSSSTGFKVRSKIQKGKSSQQYGYVDHVKEPKEKPGPKLSRTPSVKQMLKTDRVLSSPTNIIQNSPKNIIPKNIPLLYSPLSSSNSKKILENLKDLPKIETKKTNSSSAAKKQNKPSKTVMFDFSLLEGNKWNLSKSPSNKDMFPVSPYFTSNNFWSKTSPRSRVLDQTSDSVNLVKAKSHQAKSVQGSLVLPNENYFLSPKVSQQEHYLKIPISPKQEIKPSNNGPLKTNRTRKFPVPISFRSKLKQLEDDTLNYSQERIFESNRTVMNKILSPRIPTKSFSSRNANSPRIKDDFLKLQIEREDFMYVESDKSSEDSTFREYVQQQQADLT